MSDAFWSGGWMLASDNIRIASFLTGFTVDRGASLANDFQVSLRIEPVDNITFKTIVTVYGDALVSSISYSAIVVDDNLVAQEGVVDLDFTYHQSSGPNTTCYFTNPLNNQMLIGMNSFRMPANDQFNFDYNLGDFSLNCNLPCFSLMNITIFQIRTWGCFAPTPYYDMPNDQCVDICPDGQYGDSGKSLCSACSSYCIACHGPASTDCDMCWPYTLRSVDPITQSCLCLNDGVFENGAAICGTCSYTCKTCASTSSLCLSCESANHRALSATSCPCDSGFIDTGAATCSTCGSQIVGCTVCSSSTVCTTCDTAGHFTLLVNTCNCVTGYYLYVPLQSCLPCNYKCYSCSSSSTSCTGCDTSADRYLSAGSCPCKNGYVDVGVTVCQSCTTTLTGCLNCTSTTVCNSCNAASQFVLAPVSASNVPCGCDTGYFLNTGACSSCDYTCTTCQTTSTTCTSCHSTRSLIPPSCPCLSGFIDVGVNVCASCSSFITGCLACSSTSVCTSCDTANHFYLAGGTCQCSSGYYLSTGACLSCSYTCQTCSSSAGYCTGCPSMSSRTYDSTSHTCPCNSGYVDVGVATCSLCSTLMTGCDVCSLPTVCTSCSSTNHYQASTIGTVCECVSGYFFDAGIVACQPCHYSCSTCVASNTHCTGCAAASHRTLDTMNGCPCDSGFTDAGVSVCATCQSFMPGCLVCSSSTVCTTCDINFQRNTTNQCECQSGFYFDGVSACLPCDYSCQNCDVLATNCTSCPAASSRILSTFSCPCDSGFANVGVPICQSCISLMDGCLTCSSSTTCSSCDTTSHYQLSTNLCECVAGYYFDMMLSACQPCDYTCATCDVASANCTSCTSHRTLAGRGNTCPCDTGFVDVGVLMCASCSSFMAGCIDCSSTTVCTTCDTTTQFQLSISTNQCECISGFYYDSGSRGCISCLTLSPVGVCSVCSSATVCSNCINGYSLVGGSCFCQIGHYVNAGSCLPCPSTCTVCTTTGCSACAVGYEVRSTTVCTEICGDGLLFVLPCDDGNLVDGDGCSSSCQIETDFVCVNGTSRTPSVCSYSKSFTMELVSTTKIVDSNSIVFDLDVRPVLAVLTTINFTAAVRVSLPTESIECAYDAGRLETTVVYTQSVQGLTASLSFDPPTTGATFAVQPSQVFFTVNPSNLDAFYIEPSTYQLIGGVAIVLKGTLGIALIVTVVGLFVSPLLGLEMMMLLQTGFFAVALLKEMQPTLAITSTLSLAVNGYNGMLDFLADTLAIKAVSLPKPLVQMSLKPRLIGNFNVMFFTETLLAALTILAGTLTYLIKNSSNKSTLWKTLTKVLTVGTMSLLIFSSFNLGFSLALEVTYFAVPSYEGMRAAIFAAVGLIALSVRAAALYLILQRVSGYTFNDAKLLKQEEQSATAKYHPVVMICYRLFLGVCIGGFCQYAHTSALVCLLQAAMTVYTAVMRPYASRLMLARAILNDLACLSMYTMVVLYVYVYTGDRTSQQEPATAYLCIMIAATVVNILCMAFIGFTKARVVFIEESSITNSTSKQILDDTANTSVIHQPAPSSFGVTALTLLSDQSPQPSAKKLKKRKLQRNHSIPEAAAFEQEDIEQEIEPAVNKPSPVQESIQEPIPIPPTSISEQPPPIKRKRVRRLPNLFQQSPNLEVEIDI